MEPELIRFNAEVTIEREIFDEPDPSEAGVQLDGGRVHCSVWDKDNKVVTDSTRMLTRRSTKDPFYVQFMEDTVAREAITNAIKAARKGGPLDETDHLHHEP